jgi:hypothetical protein
VVDEFSVLCPRVEAADRVDDCAYAAAGLLGRHRVDKPLDVAATNVRELAPTESRIHIGFKRPLQVADG